MNHKEEEDEEEETRLQQQQQLQRRLNMWVGLSFIYFYLFFLKK